MIPEDGEDAVQMAEDRLKDEMEERSENDYWHELYRELEDMRDELDSLDSDSYFRRGV